MEDILRTTAYLTVLFGTIGWVFTLAYIKCRMKKTTEWPLEGMEMELQPCPVRLIDCVYHDKKGLVQQCLVTYPANGWVLNKELVTELVRERKNDFKELLSFQIR